MNWRDDEGTLSFCQPRNIEKRKCVTNIIKNQTIFEESLYPPFIYQMSVLVCPSLITCEFHNESRK